MDELRQCQQYQVNTSSLTGLVCKPTSSAAGQYIPANLGVKFLLCQRRPDALEGAVSVHKNPILSVAGDRLASALILLPAFTEGVM